MRLFEATFAELLPDLRAILAAVGSVPLESRPGTAHIDRMESILQYVFYVALVREWLDDPAARVLDWGGQHGQVTRLLSRYYPNTTCYALDGDEYDRLYGLADWHRRLGIASVVRSADPRRLTVAGPFDAVISSGVLEHVGEGGVTDREALNELNRVLRPGGMLFVWNLPRLFGREFLYPLVGRTTHAKRYRRAEIVALLHACGFEVRHLATHELLPIAVLKRLGPWVGAHRLLHWDYAASERLPWLAQNFTIVAQKQSDTAA